MSWNELSQTDALELRNSGADYLMLGQYENAFKHFMKSLEYEPNKALTLRLLTDAYLHQFQKADFDLYPGTNIVTIFWPFDL